MPVNRFDYKPKPIFKMGRKELQRFTDQWKGNPLALANAKLGQSFAHPNGSTVNVPAPSYYGVEWEMEQVKHPEVSAQDVIANKYEEDLTQLYLYLKHDGSLKNGFEVVSHPRTYSSWVEVSKQMKDLLRKYKNDGMRSRDTGRCGIHFHTNLTSFRDDMHVVKWGTFFQINAPFFYTACRRTPESCKKYAWFARSPMQWAVSAFHRIKSLRGTKANVPFTDKLSNVIDLDHHSGVTITRHTIELRFFRGTMDMTSTLRLMRFQERLKEYTLYAGFSDLTIEKFFNWVKEKHDDTKLINYFKKTVSKTKEVPYRDTVFGERVKPVSGPMIAKELKTRNQDESHFLFWTANKVMTLDRFVQKSQESWDSYPRFMQEAVMNIVGKKDSYFPSIKSHFGCTHPFSKAYMGWTKEMDELYMWVYFQTRQYMLRSPITNRMTMMDLTTYPEVRASMGGAKAVWKGKAIPFEDRGTGLGAAFYLFPRKLSEKKETDPRQEELFQPAPIEREVRARPMTIEDRIRVPPQFLTPEQLTRAIRAQTFQWTENTQAEGLNITRPRMERVFNPVTLETREVEDIF